MSQSQFYVGIDWSTSAHQVCVLNGKGEVVGEGQAGNGKELLAFVRQQTNGLLAEVSFAIERADLNVVDCLLDEGAHVWTLNPKQVDRFRDRYSPAGAKDDRRDALVLASSLRTDVQAYRRVVSRSSEEVLLRALHRTREQVQARKRAGSNQLRAELFRIFPGLLQLCPGADGVWFREVVRLIAAADAPQALPATTFVQPMKRLTRLSPEDVVAALRSSHPPTSAQWEAFGISVRLLLDELALMHEQLKELERRMTNVLASMKGFPEEPSNVDILRSLTGFGVIATVVFAAVLADALDERDIQRMRTMAGIAPVTVQSGRTRTVRRRRACHHAVQQAMFHAAAKAASTDPRFKAIYKDLRARGHGRPRALRSVADAMLRVLVAMLRDRTLYAPTQDTHGRQNSP